MSDDHLPDRPEDPDRPSEADAQADADLPDDTQRPHPFPRRVRPRDWAVVAVVAAIAVTLSGYLLLRPTDTASTDNRGSAQSTTTTALASGTGDSGSSQSSGTAPSGPSRTLAALGGTADSAPMTPSSPGTSSTTSVDPPAASSGPAAGNDGGVVDSMIQPSVITKDQQDITDGEQATRIGPFGDLARRINGDPLAVGRVDAPVVMVMFSDYRCPFCGQFSRTTEQQLIKKYVTPGVLRIEWRDLPIFGPESVQAAIAGRAAAQQGKFWEFNSAVYAAAPQRGHADLDRDSLITYARTAHVPDIDAFTAALDDPKLAAAVDKDTKEGSFLGVPSTPAFVIDGYPLLGAQPLAKFNTLIDTVQTLS